VACRGHTPAALVAARNDVVNGLDEQIRRCLTFFGRPSASPRAGVPRRNHKRPAQYGRGAFLVAAPRS